MAQYSDWSTSLNSCIMDPKTCLFTMFCCPARVAVNKASLENRPCTCYDVLFILPCQEYFNRQQIRAKYGFEQDACADCLAISLCVCCVSCQHAREIRLHETHIAAAAEGQNYFDH